MNENVNEKHLSGHAYELIKLGVPGYVIDEYPEHERQRLLEDVRGNPWTCYNKDTGFSINLCQRLSNNLNINLPEERTQAYLLYSLDQIASEGHCYANERQLKSKLSFHKVTTSVDAALVRLAAKDKVFKSKSDNYFLTDLFYAEKSLSNKLLSAKKLNGQETGFEGNWSERYNALSDAQKAVVDAVDDHKLIILTGLPGTGKTTTIQAIVDCYGAENVALLAPTGKAAARMSELCGIEARTLHSFFFNPMGGGPVVITNTIVIVDEVSMMDAQMAKWIGEGVHDSCVLILCGDPDQLPSVGPGSVLSDILASGALEDCHFHLTEIMRQKPGSILQSAHAIHAGKMPVVGDDKEITLYYPEKWDMTEIANAILKQDEWNDAQFLSVLKGDGSQILNPIIQKFHYTPTSKFDTIEGFEVGDSVIHIKNNRKLGVFNGEMGIVASKEPWGIGVEYQNKYIFYNEKILWQLELAYCITVHKAQGSEFDKVVLILNESQITTRNLLYTGLTRAKRKLMIVAKSERVICDAINKRQPKRQTSLPFMLKGH